MSRNAASVPCSARRGGSRMVVVGMGIGMRQLYRAGWAVSRKPHSGGHSSVIRRAECPGRVRLETLVRGRGRSMISKLANGFTGWIADLRRPRDERLGRADSSNFASAPRRLSRVAHFVGAGSQRALAALKVASAISARRARTLPRPQAQRCSVRAPHRLRPKD
jgi:hypothetical protein